MPQYMVEEAMYCSIIASSLVIPQYISEEAMSQCIGWLLRPDHQGRLLGPDLQARLASSSGATPRT